MKEKKQSYFKKALAWAKRRHLSNIKANYGEFDSPARYSKEGEEKPYIPDLTGKGYRTGTKYYIEIALKTKNKKRSASKWKLLDTLASIKDGKFYLLAPRGHKAFVKRMLKKYQLPNAEMVYLPEVS